MVIPKVTEIAALSAHRQQVALVRRSLVAVPEPMPEIAKPDPRNPLHRIDRIRSGAMGFDAAW
jgi:hypothetical protein